MKTEYEIVECKNGKAIPVFADMCLKMKDWGYSREELVDYFTNRFGLPEFKVFVEPNLCGIMAVMVIQPLGERYLSIEAMWTDPKKPGLTEQFIKVAEGVAKSFGIKKLFTTLKRPSLMKRYGNAESKYGFIPYAITAIKELED